MSSDNPSGKEVRPQIVFAEYDAWIQDNGELFDTTSEEKAKENDIFDEKAVYEPQPLMLNKDRLFKGLEKSISAAEINKDHEVVLPPDDAAGPRDPKLVELFPIREFLKQDITPQVGLKVTIKNRVGYISAVTAGRVRVDFNNRLAGKTLKYQYKIVSEAKEPDEIFRAILKMNYGSSDGFSLEMTGKIGDVKLPDVCKYDQKWLLSKYGVVNDLRDTLPLDSIRLIEEYARPDEGGEDFEEKDEESDETAVESTDSGSEEVLPDETKESETQIDKESD